MAKAARGRLRWLAVPLTAVFAVTLAGQQPALAAPRVWQPPALKDGGQAGHPGGRWWYDRVRV